MHQNQSFRACSLMRLRDHPRDHDNFPTRFQTTLNTTLSSRTAFQRVTYRTKWKLCVGSSGQKIITKIVNVRYSTSLQHVLIYGFLLGGFKWRFFLPFWVKSCSLKSYWKTNVISLNAFRKTLISILKYKVAFDREQSCIFISAISISVNCFWFLCILPKNMI